MGDLEKFKKAYDIDYSMKVDDHGEMMHYFVDKLLFDGKEKQKIK